MRRNGIDRDQRADPAGERAAHRIGRRADIGGEIERPQHRRKPRDEIVGGALDQEGRRIALGRPRTPGAQKPAIEDHRMRHCDIVGSSGRAREARSAEIYFFNFLPTFTSA